MALVPCKECGNFNARDAKTCPRCGTSLRRTSLAAKLFLGFLALVLVGEVRNTLRAAAPPPTVQAAVAAAPTQEASPLAAPEPEPPSAKGSVATFTKGGLLDECTDLTLTFRMGVDAGADVLDKMFGRGPKKQWSRLQKSCMDQFRDRTPLARCTMENDIAAKHPDAGITYTSIESRYYDLDSLADDVYMRQCIDSKGDWQAVDKKSEEYREALRARARREIEQMTKTVQGMAGQ